MISRPFALLAVLLFLQGCPRPGSFDALGEAGARAGQPGAGARTLALGGFQSMLVKADLDEAQRRFDQAVSKDPGEPYGLTGQILMARRKEHPEIALRAALQLLERSPRHPLASAAARTALDLSGTATALDDEILSRGARALAGPLSGDAANLLRNAIANIHGFRGESEAQAAALSELGSPDRFTLFGPFSPYHRLAFDTDTAPEQTGSLEGPLQGAYGAIAPRELRFYDGKLGLEGEGTQADVYLLAADFELPAAARFNVRTVSQTPHKVYVDGARVIERDDLRHPVPSVGSGAVELEPGRHRVLLKMQRDEGQTGLTLSLGRSDGRPSNLKFAPASGKAPRWGGVRVLEAQGAYPETADLARALEPEVGQTLARFLAVRDGYGRDRDGAKRLLAELAKLEGPALAALRAEVALADRSIPQKVARGRATRDLETAAEKDKGDVHSRLVRAGLALDEGRHLDAAEYAKQARAAFSPPGYPVLMTEARIQLALGVDAQAAQSARDAEQAEPGLCEAENMEYDVARRRDAAQEADALVEKLSQCPGHLSRSAEHARTRGDLGRAALLLQRLVDRDPGHIPAGTALADVLVAQKEYGAAIAVVEHLFALWPRSAELPKKLGEILDLAGRKDAALAMREKALLIDGSDLTLRRSVERAKTGKEPLADYAIGTQAAIAAYEAKPGEETGTVAQVLDMGAVRAYPDGSMLDRIHTVQKALEQGGIDEIAEVNVPQGAQIVSLRTIKKDGSVLEPESIEGKETVSLPGVQVGDYVDFEYLQAHASRGPALPGFTAASFYYQLARVPNHWSTYKVIAPKGAGMAVDAHNVKAEQPTAAGDEELFSHEERRVAPYIPEPDAPPSPNEYLPFVQVGAGAHGDEGIIAAYSDAYLEKAQVTFEVEQFAQEAAAGKTGVEAAKAIYAAVAKRLKGRDSGLSASAAASLAQDRGSRLWTLKAALEAAGIPARVAAVRSFSADPAPYVFPNESLYPYVCLRIEPKGSAPVWLDALVRFGPFGELPEQASDREALLFPEPGKPVVEAVRTAKTQADPRKRVKLESELSADGVLTGTAEETYVGFDAAQLMEALEALSPDQRDQALQSALSRYFGGAELSSLKVEMHQEVGAPLVVRYAFRAPRFGRVEGGKIVIGPLTFPAQLGRRFVEVGARSTPLYIGDSEGAVASATMKLPAGMHLESMLSQPIQRVTPFGEYSRTEAEKGGVFSVAESYLLKMARLPPKDYEAFATFAGEVDLVQARDVTLAR